MFIKQNNTFMPLRTFREVLLLLFRSRLKSPKLESEILLLFHWDL